MNDRQKAILRVTSCLLTDLATGKGDFAANSTATIVFKPDHPIFGKSVSLAYLADALRLEVLPALSDGGGK